ncbi:hypothetical protein AX15_006277 [Amanita polypyramis BW_CC]|nr:hypothetical protein AX15_006277 [Amanita polypyramis BW_CC]
MSTPPPSSIQSLSPFLSTSTTRLHALYSDISRQKHSNPASYRANVGWWQRALESVVSSGAQHTRDTANTSGRLVLHVGRSLMDSFKVEGVGKPLGLGAVIDELRASKALIPLSYFLTTKQSIYGSGWLPTRIVAFVVGKPLWWTMEQLGIVGEDGFFTPSHRNRGSCDNDGWWGEYVFVALLERAADSVMEKQRSKATGAADSLYSPESFKNDFGSVLGQDVLKEEDTLVLLKFLERDRGLIVMNDEVIKFVSQSASPEERQISAVDHGILELKTAISHMHMQIDSLHNKIDEYTRKASESLRLRRKTMALNYLRSRKQLEDLANKRLGSLSTLESTLISVEAAAGDIEIMKAYESSTTTLRAILTHPSLQRESVERTLDALADANTDAKEVDDAIRLGAEVAMNSDQIDDAEVEMELNRLIAEAEQSESDEHRKVEHKLGDVKVVVPQAAFVGGEGIRTAVESYA